jgi:hypothetical protein
MGEPKTTSEKSFVLKFCSFVSSVQVGGFYLDDEWWVPEMEIEYKISCKAPL